MFQNFVPIDDTYMYYAERKTYYEFPIYLGFFHIFLSKNVKPIIGSGNSNLWIYCWVEIKDWFDRDHNPSHLTFYPEVLKIKKTIIVAK